MPVLRSLRHRLLLATLVTAGLTLMAAGILLSALFRDHVRRQFIESLNADLDQVMARLEVDKQGQPALEASQLSDPRWSRPGSGRYWQVDGSGTGAQPALLRSRSLWDQELGAPRDSPSPGELHVHDIATRRGESLLMIERTLTAEGAKAPWRVMVAADMAPMRDATKRFNAALGWSLAALLILLVAAALVQVRVALSPLKHLRRSLEALREGRTQRLEGHYPEEIHPLVEDLNGVLNRHAEVIARARAQAGNLAHALKTPLTILAQEAEAVRPDGRPGSEFPQLVLEQVQLARRHIDWHLARSRAAAAQGAIGVKTALAPATDGLVRVMQKIYADRKLDISTDIAIGLAFAGEAQDLQEMLGNLLDNACKAARHRVRITGRQEGRQLQVLVEDDGPGIAASQLAPALERGHRLDESTPGSGLGLAIVRELAGLYGGTVSLNRSSGGGLAAALLLPAA